MHAETQQVIERLLQHQAAEADDSISNFEASTASTNARQRAKRRAAVLLSELDLHPALQDRLEVFVGKADTQVDVCIYCEAAGMCNC